MIRFATIFKLDSSPTKSEKSMRWDSPLSGWLKPHELWYRDVKSEECSVWSIALFESASLALGTSKVFSFFLLSSIS